MAVKSRLTALFEEAEDVGERVEISNNRISIEGGSNVVIQQRWIWDSVDQGVVDWGRITWRSGELECSNLSRVVSAALSPGFNVYSGLNESMDRSLETPFYRSYHSNVFELEKFLPVLRDQVLAHLDAERCDIDLRLTPNRTEVTQWCLLRENETASFEKEPDVDACEAGLFYLDTSDHIDVNLSGLRCKWGDDGEMKSCQKTTLFYKTAHVPVEAVEHPVVELEAPVGLHPKILFDLRGLEKREKCEYFVYLQLPVDLFVDKFQSSPVFLYGEQDLELPEYKLRERTWGSEALFQLAAEAVNEVTLHSRYAEPIAGNYSKKVVVFPLLFRACDSDDKNITQNPFYSRGVGYESFFTPNTIFAAFQPPPLQVDIPRPDVSHYETTKMVTLACLLFSLVYISSKLFAKPRSRRYNAK